MMKYFAWLAVIISLMGALLVAHNIRAQGYCGFIVGAIIFVLTECKNKNYPQVSLNAAYLLINILGLYHAIKN